MAPNGPERRQAWRYPVSLDVSLGRGKGVSQNVSASGIYFETNAAFAPGQTIAFSFKLEKVYPDVQLDLHCHGKIVRVERRGEQVGVAATIDAWTFERCETPGSAWDAEDPFRG